MAMWIGQAQPGSVDIFTARTWLYLDTAHAMLPLCTRIQETGLDGAFLGVSIKDCRETNERATLIVDGCSIYTLFFTSIRCSPSLM